MTTKKLEAETGLDELRVRLGLSWLREKGYASKDFRNRWTLDRGKFAVNPVENPKANYEEITQLRGEIKRWIRSTGRTEPMEFYSARGWAKKSGKKTEADLIVCCDTQLRRALRRAEKGTGSSDDLMMMEEFSEVVGDAGFHYQIKPTHIELYSLGINPKKKKKKPTVKQRAKKVGKKIKKGAKRAGKEIKKGAKTDVGRAGIGAGAGALLLGPIGAVAGAGIAMATKKKKKDKKKGKKNPEKMVKLTSLMGNLLLDYHKVSDNVEHLAAATLRGSKVPLSDVRRARADLHRAKKIQISAADKEQIDEIVSALDQVIAKHSMKKKNPVSLETAIKRGRQKKARKSASRAVLASGAASSAGKQSLRKKLASINPSTYIEQLPMLSDKALESEHKAISGLIRRADKSPEASKRMLTDLLKIRTAITDEKKRRRKSKRPMTRRMSSRSSSRSNPPKSKPKLTKLPKGTKITRLPSGKAKGAEPLTPYAHEYTEEYERRGSGQKGGGMIPAGVAASYGRRMMGNPKKNPRKSGRKGGRFTSVFTPSQEELKLIEKYNAFKIIEGKSPRVIEEFVKRLRKLDKDLAKRKKDVRQHDPELAKLAEKYRKRRQRHSYIVTAPDSTPGEIARSQRMLDKLEDELVMYAEMRNMDPEDLRKYMEHARRKQKSAKSSKRRMANPRKRKGTKLPKGTKITRLPPATAHDFESIGGYGMRGEYRKGSRAYDPAGPERTLEQMMMEEGVERGTFKERFGNPLRSDRYTHRGYDAVFSKGSPLAGMGDKPGYTFAIFDKDGKMIRYTYTPVPMSQAKKIFKEAIDQHLDEDLPVNMTVPLAMRKAEMRAMKKHPRRMANPSKPISEKKRKGMTPKDWAELNMKNYRKHMKAFESSMEVDDPDYECLVAANLDAYGAEINYRDAGDSESADKMMKERKRISKELSAILS